MKLGVPRSKAYGLKPGLIAFTIATRNNEEMQTELMYRKPMITTRGMSSLNTSVHRLKRESPKDSRETIHSGHFMVSDFEAEAQDDEDELAVPVPEEEAVRNTTIAPVGLTPEKLMPKSLIENSLNKLFQCMSLAYSHIKTKYFGCGARGQILEAKTRGCYG
ncbi:Protein of unknown function [Cotesia congregata]|uniref:Uncharacterized protein n=1 Tax=Cotesia congregata TaxID=51543 RepID=A0A8J2MJ75_COTCN|nr:Protein of unknown function [Cotesia congregata]